MKIQSRWLFLAIFLACAAMIGAALYIQRANNLEPCPLCILQRVAFIAIGATGLVAFLHNPKKTGSIVYGALVVLLALAGGTVSARHIWLQHLPPDAVPECGPGLDYMLESFPLTKALPMVFKGSGECAKIDWTMFGFTIPELALGAFVILAFAGLQAMLYRERRRFG